MADGFLSTLSAWTGGSQFLGGLIIAAVGGIASLLVSAYVGRRRLGYTVLYDQQINQGDPVRRPLASARSGGPADAAQATPSLHMWDIVYTDHATGADERKVEDGSLVVMRLRNAGWQTIKAEDFDQGKITLIFPGRRVIHYKIRDNREYHQVVHDAQQPGGDIRFAAPAPGDDDQFNLPALTLDRGQGFEVLTLLEDDPDWRGLDRGPKVTGYIVGGGAPREYSRPRRWPYLIGIVALVVLTVVSGVIVGDRIGSRRVALSPVCAKSGNLTIAGSTAFAPVFNQVVTEYEQLCPGPQITVSPVGSVAGLATLTKATSDRDSIIAMYDGLPARDPGLAYDSQPAGDVIFAVVGNRSLSKVKASVFSPGTAGGMTRQQIADAYDDPANGGFSFFPAGREANSGTRQAFVKKILVGYDDSDGAEAAAQTAKRTCGQPAVATVCLAQTTMDVLQYVSTTPDAIGYAEDDALAFFPNVSAIPVDGYAPTRANALAGNYRFLATEHLYTYGQPTGLAADLINFLTSAPVIAQLRDTSFIACADLAGSALSTDCQPS
jgi:ABC-type phosphate transport system substrate-binding protein